MLSEFLDDRRPRSTRVDLVLLTLLCAFTYLFGITDYGVASWHEAIRLVTAIDMQEQGHWLVPTIAGEPYLSKPPLLYWTTIAIAELAGQKVALVHLRLAIAMYGWLSVVLTYLAGRSMLAEGLGWSKSRASQAAFWAGLFLATGFLHVRLSRTGAIDMAVTPFVVAAVWAGFTSWRRSEGWRLSAPLTIAMFAIAGAAALVKGPPTLLAIACALAGGGLGWLAINQHRASSPLAGAMPYVAGVVAFAIAANRIEDVETLLGAIIAGLLSGWLVWGVVRLSRAGITEIGRTLWTLQIPAAVIGSLLPLFVWSRLVAARIGEQAVQANAVTELNENLTFLDPDSSSELFGAAAFGCGLGSLYAFIACWLLLTRRLRPTPGLAVVAAWVGVTLLAFIAFSTGSTRYITPMLPGVALLGAAAWVTLRDHPRREWMTTSTAGAVIVLAVAQAWWYGDGRNRFIAHHSPRDFFLELVGREHIDTSRLATWGFWNGGLTAYAGHTVWPITREGFGMDAPAGVWTLEEFADRLRTDSAPWVLLISYRGMSETDTPELPSEVRALGLTIHPVPIDARYSERKGREPVRAYRVSP